MGVDAWLPWRGAVPLDLLFFQPPPRVERPPSVSPFTPSAILLGSSPNPPFTPLRRVTLYLFKAPSDRPFAACTESTWRFRWDLNARGGFGWRTSACIENEREREREREGGRMQTERPPGRFSISAGFVSVRVTAVHRRDFHAPTVSQQADYTSGQQPRRSSPPSSSCSSSPGSPGRDYRLEKLESVIALLQRHSSALGKVLLNLGISRVRSDNSENLECISRSIVPRESLVDRGINAAARESALSEKFIAARQKSAPRCKYTREEHAGGKKGENSPAENPQQEVEARGSPVRRAETKIPFVDSSPSEPKD